ncbi:MAG: 2-C-methyl-D-erythritol 2,4-cyclodiphosphate synthase [Acidimicrobiia bacterium]
MSSEPPVATTRVGWGFDAHALNDEPPLLLGGVEVSDSSGLAATSDGDVLAHAITDAILGACVLGDLGEHFPSTDPRFHGVSSLSLLSEAAGMAANSGFAVSHVDATVIAERIRVAPHRQAIRESIAAALGIPTDLISVKATSTDGLGFTGTSQGVAAVAVVTVITTS